jgi:DNA-binding PadR family transcriptional regulator
LLWVNFNYFPGCSSLANRANLLAERAMRRVDKRRIKIYRYDISDHIGGEVMVRFGGFGPFFRGFERGEMKYMILNLLADKPRHGYEIIKELESLYCGFYTPSAGTVYPNLQLLEDLELVKSREQDGKRIYEITDKGRQELKTRKEKVEDFRDRAEHWRAFRMEDLNDLFEDLADLKKHVRMQMQAHGLTSEKMKRIRKIISNAKEEIIQVLKSQQV